MTVLPFPLGRWAWDARGEGRAVRVSPHTAEGILNLSVWRDDLCVGTVRLRPAEVAGLVEGLTEGLAQLAERPAVADAAADTAAEEKLRGLEERLARLESRLRPRDWRAAVTGAADRARDILVARLPGRPA
jgi:hypothetical protein